MKEDCSFSSMKLAFGILWDMMFSQGIPKEEDMKVAAAIGAIIAWLLFTAINCVVYAWIKWTPLFIAIEILITGMVWYYWYTDRLEDQGGV